MNEPIISPLVVYLITRLDSIRDVLQIVSCVCAAGTIIIGTFEFVETGETPVSKRWAKVAVATAAVAGLSLAFLPTTKDAIMIYAAGKITPQTLQSAGNDIDKAIDKVIQKIMTLEKRSDK